MNKKDKFVITINRQFGTGGHEIGVALAERLGVKLLDKQVLKAMAMYFGVSEDAIAKLEARNESWQDDFTQFYQGYMSQNEYRADGNEITSQQLFDAQAKIIRKIAAEESCVVIGRCAFDIFRDHPNALKIFVHSPDDVRIRRIVEKYGLSDGDAKMMLVDNDLSRELYTKTFTGQDRYDVRNYDLTLNVARFGVNGAVDYIMRLIE